MKPIETLETDTTFGGVASKGINDLPTQTLLETLPDKSIVEVHRSVWELEPAERAAIMLGARFVLDVYGGAVPPMRLAVAEPTLTDPESVYALVDQAIAISVGTSIAAVLRDVDVERDVATVVAWSDDEKREISDWLRGIGEGATIGIPPAALGLSDDERVALRAAIAARATKEVDGA